MSNMFEFYVQYVSVSYNKITSLPEENIVSPIAMAFSYPGNPNIKNSKHIQYFKFDSGEYEEKITQFPYKKVTGIVLKEYDSGKLVFLSPNDKAQFSWRKGPTCPCYILFLYNNGKMFPLLDLKDVENIDKYIVTFNENGCGLHWESVDSYEQLEIKIDSNDNITVCI